MNIDKIFKQNDELYNQECDELIDKTIKMLEKFKENKKAFNNELILKLQNSVLFVVFGREIKEIIDKGE